MTRERAVKVGIAGCGYIAQRTHLPILRSHNEVRLEAACDVNFDLAKRVCKAFNIPSPYKDVGEMVEKEHLDLVDICVPPQHHAEVALRSLRSGSSCLIEKPIALTLEEVDAIIASARDKRLGLYPIQNFAVMPSMRKAREIVNSGRLGRIVDVGVRYCTSLDDERYVGFRKEGHWISDLKGGIMGDILPHLLQLYFEFVPSFKVIKLSTMKLSKQTFGSDEIRIIVESPSSLGTLSLSFNSHSRIFTLDVTGTRGSIHANGDSQEVIEYRPISSSMDSRARISRAAGEITQRVTAYANIGARFMFGRIELENYGHAFLIDSCIQTLLNKVNYPVDLSSCREAVRAMQSIS